MVGKVYGMSGCVGGRWSPTNMLTGMDELPSVNDGGLSHSCP